MHFCISHLGGIGHGLSLDRAVFPGNYRPGNTALVFPVHISQPMFTLVLVLGVSVLEYLIGEDAKYLYLYLITST